MRYITKISLTINFKIVVLSFVVEAIDHDDFAGLLTAEKRNLIRPRKVSAIDQGLYAIRKICFPED